MEFSLSRVVYCSGIHGSVVPVGQKGSKFIQIDGSFSVLGSKVTDFS